MVRSNNMNRLYSLLFFSVISQKARKAGKYTLKERGETEAEKPR